MATTLPVHSGSTKLWVASLVAIPVSAVLFGIGVIPILASPALAQQQGMAILILALASFVLSFIIGWVLAPRLLASFWRGKPGDAISGNKQPETVVQKKHDDAVQYPNPSRGV